VSKITYVTITCTSGLPDPAGSFVIPVFPKPYKRATATPPEFSSQIELEEYTS